MYDADRPLTLLYLINVMQPVPLAPLKRNFRTLTKQMGMGRAVRYEGVEPMLDALMHRDLIRRKANTYFVTGIGLHKLASLGFGRVRDKHRLLLLNRLL